MDLNELYDLSDEDYFGHLKTMFRTTGWQVFIAECTEQATLINSAEDTTDNDNLFFRKGQLAVIRNIINTELRIQQAEAETDAPDA